MVEVHYTKADPGDLLMTVEVTNAGPEPDVLHVLPTLWFRNTWSWDPAATASAMTATGRASVAVPHPFLGELEFLAGPGPDGTQPELLFCDNETNPDRLYGQPGPRYPKDGISDHIVSGAATVNPEHVGSKVRGLVPAGGGPGRDAARPPVERQCVQRVLPRRQRGGAGGVPPDRLDRPGRRSDPAPPWRGALDR